MATPPTIDEEHSELQDIEQRAAEHLQEEGLAAVEEAEREGVEPAEYVPYLRLAVVAGFPVLAAAVMSGGVFVGISPRIWAALAGIAGVALAVLANRQRRALLVNITLLVGVFVVGLLVVLPTGIGNVFDLAGWVARDIATGEVIRPPAQFTPGWRAILAWLMSGIGVTAGWAAIELRRPGLALMVPVPVVAIAAISVPDSDQLASGVASLILFALGLGLLSSTGAAGDEAPPLGYELRRAARALPLIAVVTVALFLLAQLNILFPQPLYDPAQEAQKPKTVPLSEVEDRVLFTVDANFTGPWRIGHLDVYDGADWRLPPFAESELDDVPKSGVVDEELRAGVRAAFEIKGLSGAVLPSLPNTVGIVAEGPRLAYDSRTGNIRLAQGQFEPGLRYTVVAARIPAVEELSRVSGTIPRGVRKFLEIQEAPGAVTDLLRRAPTTSAWEKLDFLRQTLLKTVVASGEGTPVSVSSSRVQDMLAGSKEATPFEIVAAQAMLARWAGIPSRIGYGFDGGDKVGELLEVRPRHGATWLEVYFPGFKWLPVVGTPQQAKFNVSNSPQQTSTDIAPSEQASVQIYVPVITPPQSILVDQIRDAFLIAIPVILGLLILYYTYPALTKALRRSRVRAWARQRGPAERIAVAYSEWRDLATDFGYRYHSDTPLMFLDRVVEDEEHQQLAWLVTRAFWGDLRGAITSEEALAAEELARTLRRRMSQAHSWTLRFVAVVSRLSLKHRYAPDLGIQAGRRKEERRAPRAA